MFELDDPDFCTTETLLPTAPFVSGISPLPNGTTIPYPLCTAQQYAHLVATSSLWSKNFVVMGDIDLSALSSPPSTGSFNFSGVFEGNGKTLSNYTITSTVAAGLLGKLMPTGIIRNLVLRDFNVTGVNRVGALVHENLGLIEHVTGTNLASSGSTGIGVNLGIAGIAGANYGTLLDVTASVTVTGVSDAYSIGGLVGRQGRTALQLQGFLTDSSVSGSVTRLATPAHEGDLVTGGAVGLLEEGNIVNTHSSVSLVSSGGMAGGLVGRSKGLVLASSAVGPVSAQTGCVGGLVGRNVSTIQASFATGSVSAEYYVGGLVGFTAGNSNISDSYATGNVQGTGDGVGGLCGRNTGAISTSYATGTVQGAQMVGGLVGDLRETTSTVSQSWASGSVSAGGRWAGGLVGLLEGQVDASYARGDVTGTSHVGGLVGNLNVGSLLQDCSSTAAAVTGDVNVGGLVGNLEGHAERCFATANVTGDTRVGGLIGDQTGDVFDSYATGSVTASGVDVGGFVGRLRLTATVVRAYSAGAVTGPAPAGGFAGEMLDTSSLEDCHFNASENPGLNAVGNSASAAGVAAKSASALRQEDTFIDWDFEDVWGILEDHSFPFLEPVPACTSGGCGLGCPCPPDTCESESDCAFGQVCGEDNGGYYDEAPDADVCWDPLCETAQRPQLCDAEGAPCGECPSEETGCLSDADCGEGEACGEDNGGHFGLSKSTNVCWPAACSVDVFVAGCGPDNAPCGLCYAIPNLCTDDSDCAAGEVCGEGNGLDFGLSASERVCWPSRCEGTPEPADVGSLSSPCGVGVCRPSCEGKQCGADDGCGDYCPVCTAFDFIDGGCVDDGQCERGLACAPNGSCREPACQDVSFFEANCGPVPIVAPCGECLDCEAACDNNECGVDPRCGSECGGACSEGLSCVAEQCVDSTAQVEPDPASTVGRLEGTLSVTPNGAASYTIPIAVPPGRAGLAPNLGVVYTSDKEDGILGMGWKLNGLPYIARCPRSRAQSGTWGHPIRFDGDDRFCMGDEMLVVENTLSDYGEDGTRYRTERETFARFESVGQEEVNGVYRGPASFKVKTKDGLEYRYGETDDASVFVQPRANRVKRAWALNEIRDRSGNVIQVRYRDTYDPGDGGSETLELLPWSIHYSPGDREVRFLYEPRSEQRVQYTTGARVYHTQRLASIQTVVGDRVTRSYEFEYEEPSATSPLVRPLLLTEMRECVLEGTAKLCKPGTQFAYQNAQGLAATEPDIAFAETARVVMDLNGDGMDDIVNRGQVGLATGERGAPFNVQSRQWPADMPEESPGGPKIDLQPRVLDYEGDGVDELVSGVSDSGSTVENEPLIIYRWTGENFAEVYRTDDEGYRFETIKTVDLNGDGLKDIYICGSSDDSPYRMKLWLSARSGGAVSYSSFARQAGSDPGDCNAETNLFLDVDGDGVANVVRHDLASGDWLYLADLPNFNGRWIKLRISPRLEPTPNILVGNSSVERVEPYPGDLSVYESSALRVANVNGDRLVDIIEYGLHTPIVWTALGGGFKYNTHPISERLSPLRWGAADVVDYDGDGRDDFVINARLYQGTDSGFVETSLEHVGLGPDAGFTNTGLGNMVGDFDGDGTQDYLWQTSLPFHGDPYLQRIDYGNTRTSFLLWVVTDGLGLQHEIRYDRADPDGQATYTAVAATCAGTDTYCIKKPPPLVSAVQVSESRMFGGYEARELQEFHYKDLRRGVDGRGSYGMAERIVTTYAPGRVFSGETREVYHNDSFELAGVLKTRETRTATLQPTRVATSHARTVTEETDWEVRQSDVNRPFPFPRETVTTTKDAGQEVVRTSVTRDADVYGNLISVNAAAADPKVGGTMSWIKRTVLTTHYDHEEHPSRIADWLIALPSHQTELSEREVAGGDQREMEFTYDANGWLETATRLGSGSEYQKTTLLRDEYGNVEFSIVADSEGRERENQVAYDSRGLFPERFVNAEGESTRVRMNEALGRVDELTDANSLIDRFYYDGFGRLTRVEGWKGDVEYFYSDPSFGPAGLDPVSERDFAKQRVTVTTSHGAVTYTDLDAFDRTVFSISEGLSGAQVIQGFAYDWDGALLAESRPHEDADDSQGVVHHEYDAWRRPSATRFPDETSIEYYYATAPTYVGSGEGLPTGAELFPLRRGLFATFATKRDSTTNYTGLPIDGGIVTDHLGVALTTSDAAATLTDLSYSGHDMLTMIDHVRGDNGPGNRTVIDRDRWERVRWIDDPDTGTSTYTYSGFDEVDTITDAEDIVSKFEYDDAGRLIELRDMTDAETLVTTWTYGDSPLSNNVGRVIQTASPDGIINEYFYKADAEPAVGLPDRAVTRIPRTPGGSDLESFTVQYKYDTLKRLSGIVYPSVGDNSFSVDLGRDEHGNVTSVTDGADSAMVYWKAEADYHGIAVSEEVLGNGVRTESTFDDLTGRILGIDSQGPEPEGLIQELAYDYYPSGLLEWQTDAAPIAGLRSYQYDALDRVVSETSGAGTRQYGYDDRGNLTLKDAQTIAYDRIEGLPVHAARKLGDDNYYYYNGKGNQYLRVGPNIAGGRQRIEYTPFNLPKQIETGPEAAPDVTTFDYDTDHARTAKRSESATTLFVGGLYERVEPNDTSGERTHKYHVFAGGRRVAQVNFTEEIAFESLGSPEYQFLSRDRLGSVHTVTDVTGAVIDQRTYDPFGQPSDAPSSSDIRAGFTGHEHDTELGLVDMGGRIFDAALGRFLTPDPLANVFNLQGLNRYSYVLNSPMNWVDPSGFQQQPPNNQSTYTTPNGPYQNVDLNVDMTIAVSGAGGDDEASIAEAPAPKDAPSSDTAESGQGQSQTTPRPVQPRGSTNSPGLHGPTDATRPGATGGPTGEGGSRPAPSGGYPWRTTPAGPGEKPWSSSGGSQSSLELAGEILFEIAYDVVCGFVYAGPAAAPEPGGQSYPAASEGEKLVGSAFAAAGLVGAGMVGRARATATSALPPSGLPEAANFAQRTFRETFSAAGRAELSSAAGTSIRTMDDLAAAIRGGLHPGQIAVNYVVRDGNFLILNTRTALALERAGVPRSAWHAINQTGDPLFEALLSGQLQRNMLGSEGIPFVILQP